MTRENWLILAAGAIAGAVVGAVAAVLAGPPAAPPAPLAPGGALPLQNTSATQVLQVGWFYYLTLQGPGAADTSKLSAYLQSIGFVDPATKGAPQVTAKSPTLATSAATFKGAVGSELPSPTATLAISALGSPQPTILGA